jgi:NAD(P)-dependent dehydrogenase (short-subunit alcohol dehydrogenase family)
MRRAVAGPEPVLLNTSTMFAHMSPVQDTSVYATSKAAALKMVECFGKEVEGFHGVSVQPGWIPTDINGFPEEAPDSGMLPLCRV